MNVEVLRTPLRVDRVYKGKHQGEDCIIHLEMESGANSKISHRLLEYNAYLLSKFELPVISIIVYPFRVSMAKSPLRVMHRKQELLTFHFIVFPLWKLEAEDYLKEHQVIMYALLPVMHGANYQTLSQALDELVTCYNGNDERLQKKLLCFSVLMRRAETVPSEDKARMEERIHMFDNLLENDPWIQKKAAEAKARGEAEGRLEGQKEGRMEGRREGHREGRREGQREGRVEGEIIGAQKTLLSILEVRFPELKEYADKRIKRISQVEQLNILTKQIVAAPDENIARFVLDTFAA
ncbi:MAG: hypothetical protein M3Z24_04765 [Chloroflexota bacterium]|nr:hypothetical protein [Chloroflexota bacterium]